MEVTVPKGSAFAFETDDFMFRSPELPHYRLAWRGSRFAP